jgi:phenylacetate-CoA ligase
MNPQHLTYRNSSAQAAERNRLRCLPRDALSEYQIEAFNRLLENVLRDNKFYRDKFTDCQRQIRSLDELNQFPTTTKSELVPRGKASLANNHSFPIDHYLRCHQTSGTTGRPVIVMDTRDDWNHWLSTWQYVLDAAELVPEDRVFMAFSFGPFIGFWSAHDACVARDMLVMPGGGLSTLARLKMIDTLSATVFFSTPTYALHMAEVAATHGIDLSNNSIRRIIVAGEPGGSVPGIRKRIETTWNASVLDHSGATEIGPWGFGSADGKDLHVTESDFLAEFLPVTRATDDDVRELVLTSLGRTGAPIIRYRTGDLVRPNHEPAENCRFVRLEGGILGRADDMLVVRGINIFPSSLESILREFESVTEYRITATRVKQMDQLAVDVEDTHHAPEKIAAVLQERIGLRIAVTEVAADSLPRFEAKGRRFIDNRKLEQTTF